jgi:hypothetical protein
VEEWRAVGRRSVMKHDGSGGTFPFDAADAAISNRPRFESEADIGVFADRDVRPKLERDRVIALTSAARARHQRYQNRGNTMNQ